MKRIIRLTESDLRRIVKKIISEQNPVIGLGDAVKVGGRSSINLSKNLKGPSGKTPGTEMDDNDFSDCEYTSEEKLKLFFKDAKSWGGSVDKNYMDLIISKLKEQFKGIKGFNNLEIVRLISQIKTQAGMGYLVKNFKMDGKDFFSNLSQYYTFPYLAIVETLKSNKFSVPFGPPGCNGFL